MLKYKLFMRREMLFCTLLAVFSIAKAQNWNKDIATEFKKENNVAIIVDLSEATIMDVSIKDYPVYYSGKFSSNEKYANMVLEKLKNRFTSKFYTRLKKKKVTPEEARFVVTYKFMSINEKGGFSGVYWVSDKGNISDQIPFERKDGRWNDFEILLMENVDKFWKSAKGGSSKGNPYLDNLFSKKRK